MEKTGRDQKRIGQRIKEVKKNLFVFVSHPKSISTYFHVAPLSSSVMSVGFEDMAESYLRVSEKCMHGTANC